MTSHILTYFQLILLTLVCSLSSQAQEVLLQCEEPSGCAPHGIIIHATDLNGNPVANAQWAITTPAGSTLQSIANPYVAIFNQPGAYTVSIVVNGTTSLFENFITVYAKPQASISTTDAEGCLPHCTSLIDSSIPGSGAIVWRSWDFGDGTASNEANPSHCYEQEGVFTPVLAIEDEHGCFSSFIAPELIHVTTNYPEASFTIGSQNSCYLPTSVEFTANLSSDVVNYSWMLDNGVVNDPDTTQQLTFSAAGEYAVCIAVENTIGCRDTSCQSLQISNEPSAQFSFENDTICAGQTVAFTNQSLPLPTSTQWDFNGDGVIDGTNNNGSFPYANAGTQIISMTAHYGSACSVTVQDTLFVKTNPSFNFTGNDLFACSPPLVTTFTNNEAFNPLFQYIWLVNGVEVANTHNLTYIFTDFGVYDVRLKRTNTAGCERSRNKINYVVIEAPELSFEYESLYCVGEAAVVSNITVDSDEPIIDYSWDFNGDGVEDALGASPEYVYDTPGEFFATLTVTLADGCIAIDTTDGPITVLDNVLPGFSAPLVESCAGESFVFCTDYNADNIYTWDFHDGSAPEQMLAVDSCVTHIYEDTGRFDVTLTVFNGACNSAITLTDYIHVVPPLALFDYEVSCTDYTVSFEDLSIEGDSLVWDFGDGSSLVVNEANPVHTYNEPGQYSVVLSAFKEGSICFDTKTLQVAVGLPSTAIELTPPMGCAPLSVGISTQANHDFWEITIENGDRITVQRNDNPFAAAWTIEQEHNGQSTSNTSNDPTSFEWPSLLFEDGGIYDVHVAVIDEFGCEAETTYTDAIEVWPGGDFSDLTSNVVNACDSGRVSVLVESTNNRAISWLWTFTDGSTSTEQSATHYFSAPFNYTNGIGAHLVVTDSNGCSSSRDIVFEAVLPAVPSFSWNAPPVCRGEDVFFSNTSLAPPNTTYHWNFGDNSTSNGSDSLVHAYSMNGAYAVCLTATNSAGCSAQWCDPNTIDVYSPVATAEFTTVLNTCLFAVNLENTSIEGGDYTWWDFGDNQTGIGDTVLHTYPIGVYDVSLVIGANNGCADTLIIEDILNYSSSVGPFTQVLDTANCAPFGVSFQAFNPNDQLFDYFWDFNDGNGDPFGGTTSSHAYTEPGAYCPSIMMTDPNGCDVYIHCTDTIVVENYAAVALLPEHLCSGEQGVVTVLNTDNLEWTHPWVSQGAQSGQLLVEADSSFAFELTAHYSDCVYQQTIEVEILPLPFVALALVDSVCANTGALTLMGGFPEGETGFYTIDGVEINALNTDLYSGEYVLTRYSYTGPNGCSNAAFDSVYVIAPPYVETLVNRSFCEADSSLLFEGAANTHFTVDGVEALDFPFTYTGLAADITLHVYDNFGCYNHSSADYMVHATPKGTIDSHDVCANEEVHVNAVASVAGSAINTILWAVDSIYSGVGNSVINLSFTSGGEHTAVFTLESNEGCVARIDTTFMVFDIPVAAFESSVACEKDTTIINDISTFGNDSIEFWNWSYDAVAIQSSGDTLIVFNNAGVTNLTLQVVTQHGCVDHAERTVVVRYAPILTAHADSHCLGEPTHFESTASIPSGGISLTEWSIEGVPHPMVGAAASYEYNEAANYSYTFGAVSNFGCRSEVTDSVWVYAIPEVSLPADEFTYCVNQQAGVLANVAVGGTSDIAGLLWTIDGEVVSEGNPGQFSLNELGAYVLDVEVTSTHGCVARATLDQPIVVYPSPTAGFTWSIDQLTDNPSVVVSPATSADVVEINYNWGDGTTDGANQHVYAADGEYEITQVVSNVFGCNAYHSETIEAYNGLQFYIPTAFTPDQNNYNETFYPVVTGSNITYYAFRVFNRWGNEVFTSTIPGEGWNGTFKGEPAQDGAYNWSVDMIVRGRADLFVKKGSVLLMR